MTPKVCMSRRKAARAHAQGVCLSRHLARIMFALSSCRSEESQIGRTKKILYMIPKYPCNLQSYLGDSLQPTFLEANCNRASKRPIAPRGKKSLAAASPVTTLLAEHLLQGSQTDILQISTPTKRLLWADSTHRYKLPTHRTTAADRCLFLFPPTLLRYV